MCSIFISASLDVPQIVNGMMESFSGLEHNRQSNGLDPKSHYSNSMYVVCCAGVAEVFWAMGWNHQILGLDELTCSQIEVLGILIALSNLL